MDTNDAHAFDQIKALVLPKIKQLKFLLRIPMLHQMLVKLLL